MNHTPLGIPETNERDAIRAGEDRYIDCPICGEEMNTWFGHPRCEDRMDEARDMLEEMEGGREE